MLSKSLLKNIRRIEITTNRLVTDVFSGQYHSVFKGRGVEFDEVREYQIGDDVKTIDWNVTARTGIPHVKKYIEERELTVMIMVDVSASSAFGTVKELKSKLAAEIAALLAFSAIRNNDRVGLMIFTDQVEEFIPSRKGTTHVLRVIREVLYFKPKSPRTDIVGALEHLNHILKRRAVVFVISDFFESAAGKMPLKKALAIANKRHDIIAVSLNDPREKDLPDCGLVMLHDAEAGEKVLIDTSSEKLRREYAKKAVQRTEAREKLFRSVGVDHIPVSTDSSYVDAMVKFFLTRRRRI